MVRAVTPTKPEAERLAALTDRALTQGPSRWSADDLLAYAAEPGCTIVADEGLSRGLLLLRIAADEAEIIDLGVAPEHRRQGLAHALVTAAATRAAGLGAVRLFLEVATENAPARALYARAGFRKVGQRPAYYRRADGRRVDALILSKDLADPVKAGP